MKILSKEKVKVLAEKNGWSLTHAEGYVDGETFRRRGKTPSTYVQVGIDEYTRGFRSGFYERQTVMPRPSQRSRDTIESIEIAAVSAQHG